MLCKSEDRISLLYSFLVSLCCSKLALVFQCTGCETLSLQPLGVSHQYGEKPHQFKFTLPHGPPVGALCEHCRHKHHVCTDLFWWSWPPSSVRNDRTFLLWLLSSWTMINSSTEHCMIWSWSLSVCRLEGPSGVDLCMMRCLCHDWSSWPKHASLAQHAECRVCWPWFEKSLQMSHCITHWIDFALSFMLSQFPWCSFGKLLWGGITNLRLPTTSWRKACQSDSNCPSTC